MTVTIRQVGPDDWVDWRYLRRRSLLENPEAFASSVTMWSGDNDVESRWRARLDDGPCFIAYDAGVPVGMVGGAEADGTTELISMWVAPESRRRGTGQALVGAVIRWSDGRPLRLRVMDGNEAAVRTYEQVGFVLRDGVDDEGCRSMIHAPEPPPHRLVAPPQATFLGGRYFGRFRRVGLRGLLGDLNRTASRTSVPAAAATDGLTWERRDRDSARWWPQGITTSADAFGPDAGGGTFEGRPLVLVSWYARGRVGRLLGSRISVIDGVDGQAHGYRHVRLVEPVRRWKFLHRLRPVRIHAGGIVWFGDLLYVSGSSHGLRVFRLDDVVRVRNRLRTAGYRYVLPQLTSYAPDHGTGAGSMVYSFLSLDHHGEQPHLIAGEYGRRGGSHRLMRFAIDADTGMLRSTEQGWAVPADQWDRQVARMQGATVVGDDTWVLTTSNGEGNPGDLWVGTPGSYTRHRGVLPTGPEDVTYWPQRRQLWTLTEWPGRRWVFGIDVDRWTDVPAVDDPVS